MRQRRLPGLPGWASAALRTAAVRAITGNAKASSSGSCVLFVHDNIMDAMLLMRPGMNRLFSYGVTCFQFLSKSDWGSCLAQNE